MAELTKRSTSLAGTLFRREALVFVLTLICSLILFVLSLGLIFQTLWDQVTQGLRLEIEREADTIARLLVFEFSHLTELETQSNLDSAVEARVERLLWEKVTFNETIKGIELIRRHADPQGQHLTYSFFPLGQPGPESEQGPQKALKSFSGSEGELIRILNREQRVDRNLLESINQGRKQEGEMLLRYFPLYIPLPDQGAVYWGVTKVGINIDVVRRVLILLENEKSALRRTLAWVMVGVVGFALGLGLLGFRWLAQKTAAPLGNYGLMNQALESGAGVDIESLLAHLKYQESQGILEIEQYQHFCLRLGDTIKSLGERLLEAAGQACAGRMAARLAQDSPAPVPGLQEWAGLFTPWPAGWRNVDLEPYLHQVSSYITAVLPPGSTLSEVRQPMPPLYGCEAHLVQAILFLVDFALTEMPPGGQLSWRALPLKTGGMDLELSFPGRSYQEEEISRLLHPLKIRVEPLPPVGPGLAAAIAREHGGTLAIQPRPGGGLNLRLNIPDGKRLLAGEGRGEDSRAG
jgi:hypothetical protein